MSQLPGESQNSELLEQYWTGKGNKIEKEWKSMQTSDRIELFQW